MSKKKPPNSPALESASPQSAPASAPYLVLARKYRPRTFDDLIGQEAMVRTLSNAFELGRIAQAYMLTGVRGVGKTTTARILARALNYAKPGAGSPTIDIAEPGEHCQAILESRHMDVVEMDAASNTGIDDIREIIESVKYMPAYARYKVFIIDEVHMLSKAAFNGLLKTLEEPPAHVKFIFATTEIRKVPVTVLSRCQRFDLRRVDADALSAHFAKIAAAEGQIIDDDALAIIARLAEGSVRDGLSLLDQAFALAAGRVRAVDVRAMAGLADGAQIYDLADAIFAGDAATALKLLTGLYEAGAEPLQILADLASAVHNVARVNAAGPEAASAGLPQAERDRVIAMAARLSTPLLARAWQMLVKGLEETARAPRTLAAAEMVLIRMCYGSNLPPPSDLIKTLSGAGAASEARATRPAFSDGQDRNAPPRQSAPPASPDGAPPPTRDAEHSLPALANFADVTALAAAKRDVKLKLALEEQVSLVRFRPGHIEIKLLENAPPNLALELSRKLQDWTGERWMVSLSETPGEAPLGEARRREEARLREEAKRHPAVQAVFRHFPGAEITAVRPLPANGAGDDATDENTGQSKRR